MTSNPKRGQCPEDLLPAVRGHPCQKGYGPRVLGNRYSLWGSTLADFVVDRSARLDTMVETRTLTPSVQPSPERSLKRRATFPLVPGQLTRRSGALNQELERGSGLTVPNQYCRSCPKRVRFCEEAAFM